MSWGCLALEIRLLSPTFPSILLAMLVLDEALRPGQWFGAAMIIAGIIVLEARRGRV